MEIGAAVALAAGIAGIFGLQINITFQLEQRWTSLQSRLATYEAIQQHHTAYLAELSKRLDLIEVRQNELLIKVLTNRSSKENE